MDYYFYMLKVLKELTNDEVISNIDGYRKKVNNIFEGLKTCGSKMKTAGQFIDFFIHDVLDYSVLNN